MRVSHRHPVAGLSWCLCDQSLGHIQFLGSLPAADLEEKLSTFKTYYNGYRAHTSLEGQTPIKTPESEGVNFKSYRWHKHCRGLYQTPTAA